MALALEEPVENDETVTLNGVQFSMDPSLIRLSKLYGQIRVDYQQKRFFGSGFRCRLGYSLNTC